MEYFSTRDTKLRVPSAKAIAQGLSRDGGLFTPVEIPKLTADEINDLCAMTYPQRAAFVLGKYLTDFTPDELIDFSEKAYSEKKFNSSSAAPVYRLDDTANILELWHGPTCAFKDMALQMLPYLLTASLKKTGEKKTAYILVATSGDTGKAALEGFADVPGTRIAVFYPKDGVSRVQELQMTTQTGDNVFVSSVYGNFDNVQSKMKEIFSNEELREKAAEKGCFFSSANSINWGRAVSQIAYYVSGYCDMLASGEIAEDEEINVCVPTGNFGNILAAYYAREMGIPIKRLICASNNNNVLTDFFKTGKYDKNREFFMTASPAMDILISSNLERLLFHLSGNDGDVINRYMSKLSEAGAYTVNAQLKEKLDDIFFADYCTDEETMQNISKVFSEHKYLVDTHTAVALGVYDKYKQQTGDVTTKTLIASTASPFKFSDSVLSALGVNVDINGVELLDILSKTTQNPVPGPLAALKDLPERFNGAVEREEIAQTVLNVLD